MTFRFARRRMLIPLASCCHIHVSCLNQIPAPPTELLDVFGSWIGNRTALEEIQTALQTGKIVLIRNAFKPDIYKTLQSEITSVRYVREPRSTPRSDIEQIGSHAFFDVPREQVCDAVDHLYGSDPIRGKRTFFFSHSDPISYTSFQNVINLKRLFNTRSVRGWVADLLGEDKTDDPVESTSMSVRRLNEGDVYGSHNDDLEGRFGGISFTAYFTEYEKWEMEWGGHFVWCADPREPIAIPPLSNTVVMFRVSETTWHHVQPLLKGSPSRYVVQVWWYLKSPLSKLRELLLIEPSNRSMVVINHDTNGKTYNAEVNAHHTSNNREL